MLDDTKAAAVQADAVTQIDTALDANSNPDIDAIAASLASTHSVTDEEARVEIGVVLGECIRARL